MIKAIVLEDFSLGKFNEIIEIERYNDRNNQKGKLYKNDKIKLNQDLAEYLINDNTYGRPFIKIIEIIPEDKKEKKAEVKTEEPKKTRGRKKKIID